MHTSPPFSPPPVHISKFTESPTLSSPHDGIPADTYVVKLTAIDAHGSRAATITNLTVLACPAPAGNSPPVAAFVGAPYTLEVRGLVGGGVFSAQRSVVNVQQQNSCQAPLPACLPAIRVHRTPSPSPRITPPDLQWPGLHPPRCHSVTRA